MAEGQELQRMLNKPVRLTLTEDDRGAGRLQIHGTLKRFDENVLVVAHGTKTEVSSDVTGKGTNLQSEGTSLGGMEEEFSRAKVSSIEKLTPRELDEL